jgi:hypothetical protein
LNFHDAMMIVLFAILDETRSIASHSVKQILKGVKKTGMVNRFNWLNHRFLNIRL